MFALSLADAGSSSWSCPHIPLRLDAYGDGCAFYRANPDFCKDAYIYADEDGKDAKDACCVCKGVDDGMVDVPDDAQACGLVFPDTDEDGCMSESEYTSSLDDSADPATRPSFNVIADVWGHDSCVSEEDFAVGCYLTFVFMDMDTNANGCLSYQEVLTATGDEFPQEEFRIIAAATDTGACTGVSYHDMFVVHVDDFTNASSSSGCFEDIEWVDSYGDDCEAYSANPAWCYSAPDYADANGDDASAKCCACQEIEPIPDWYGYDGYGPGTGYGPGYGPADCTDMPGASSGQMWFDGTNGCAEYADNDFCPLYGHVDYNGEGRANERCCVCGGGIAGHATAVNDDVVCQFESTDYGLCDGTTSWLGDTSDYPNAEACHRGCLERYRAAPPSCTWVENNINFYGEVYAGDVESEEECIVLVRQQCPTATIANLDTSVGPGSNVRGSCWCQWGTNLTLVPGSGWKNCLLTPYKWDDGHFCGLNDSFVPSTLMFAEWWSEGEGYECSSKDENSGWCPTQETGCGCWCTWECNTPDRLYAEFLAQDGSVGDIVGVSEAACNIMRTTDSSTCTYMSFPCSDIASGGWGADAAVVCDPVAGPWYVCDESGKHASIACAKTCSETWQSSDVWDENGDDSCVYAFDGMCDEPYLCSPGTDTSDCYATDLSSCNFYIFDTDMNGCMSEGEYYMQVDANDASYPSFGVIDGAWGLDGCVSEDDFYNGCFLTLYFREHDANGDGCWSYSEYYAAYLQSQGPVTFDNLDANGDECIRYAEAEQYGVSRKEFDMYDVSEQDGCVTRDEYGAGQQADYRAVAGEDNCLSYADLIDAAYAVPQAPELDEFESFYNQQFTPKQDMCVMFAPGEQFPAQEELLDSHAKCTGQGHAWMSPRYYQEGQWNSEPTCEAGVCSSAPWDWSLAKKKDQCESVGGVCSTSCPVCRHEEWFWYESNEEYCIADAIGSEDACNNKGMTWNAEYSTCFTDVQSPACVGGTRILSCRDLDLGACDASVLADPIYDGTALDETSGEFGLKCYIDYYAPCKNKTVCESGGSCNDEDYTSWGDSPVCRIPFTQGLCA